MLVSGCAHSPVVQGNDVAGQLVPKGGAQSVVADTATATKSATPPVPNPSGTQGTGDGSGGIYFPAIISIGDQSDLIFDRPARAPLRIPIEGISIKPQSGSVFMLHIDGPVPFADSEYSVVWTSDNLPNEPDSDLAEIVIQPSYVNQLETGDTLTVTVGIRRPAYLQPSFLGHQTFVPSNVAFAHRVFTCWTATDYRTKVVPYRLSPKELGAFPVPESQAKQLFGPLIANNFFVVQLTMRNLSTQDRLVDLGLISASGRAIVRPIDKSLPTYTVPITILPSGPTQVFTILDDEEAEQLRPSIFRGLEFAGALATAGVESYSVASEWRKLTSLFTGVFIPESQKLWPDRWPGYKRNVVNFALPELTKVPKSGTTGLKYIFFSKQDLELIISDQMLYRVPSTFGMRIPFLTSSDEKKPDVRIASIAFDALDVPFEDVVSPIIPDVADRFAKLQSLMVPTIERLKEVEAGWVAGTEVAPGVAFTAIRPIKEKVDSLNTALQNAKDAPDQLKTDVNDLKVLLDAFNNASPTESGPFESAFSAESSAPFSIHTLQEDESKWGEISKSILSNAAQSDLDEELTAQEAHIHDATAFIGFIDEAARQLTAASFVNAVDELTTGASDLAKHTAAEGVIQSLHTNLVSAWQSFAVNMWTSSQ